MDTLRIRELIRQGCVDPFHAARYHKDAGSPPAAPDYAAAAQAQGQANVDAARVSGRMNNPNVYTPYGNQTVTWGSGQPVFNETGYNQAMSDYQKQLDSFNATGGRGQVHYGGEDGTTAFYDNPNGGTAPVMPTREGFTTSGGADQPTVTQTLNPQSQQIFDLQQQVRQSLAGLANRGTDIAGGVLNKPFSFNGPNVQTSLDTSGIARMPVNAGQTAQDAILSRLEPQFARQRTSLETQLTNQGLRPGSEAWDNAMRDFSQQQTDQRTQAAAQGIGLDMTANNQGFNQAVQSGTFGNTAQNQALVQALQQRSLPLNEITALMSGSQISNPQFQGYQGNQISPAPVMQGVQAQNAAQMGAYNANAAQANNFNNGLFSLGAAAVGAPTGTFKSRG